MTVTSKSVYQAVLSQLRRSNLSYDELAQIKRKFQLMNYVSIAPFGKAVMSAFNTALSCRDIDPLIVPISTRLTTRQATHSYNSTPLKSFRNSVVNYQS